MIWNLLAVLTVLPFFLMVGFGIWFFGSLFK